MFLADPLGIGFLGGDLGLDFLVGDDPPFPEVHQEHLSRLKPPLVDDVGFRNRQHPDLGSHDHEVILGHHVARRPQTVSVEDGADHLAVGEGDGRRPVPRLHHGGVEFVKTPFVVVHGFVTAPGLGNHHHDRVGQRTPGLIHQFQSLVEIGRVASPRRDDGQNSFHLGKQRGFEHGLAGPHPVAVSPDGVDFPVVGDIPERLRPAPGRKRVGAVPRMGKRQCRLHVRILDVQEIGFHLGGHQLALVDQGLAGQAADIKTVVVVVVAGAADSIGHLLPNLQQFALQLVAAAEAVRGANEHLADDRLHAPGGLADGGIVHRNFPPPQEPQAHPVDHVLKNLDAGVDIDFPGKEHQAGPVTPRFGQIDADPGGFFLQELVGHLDQNACPVPGQRIGTAGAAVLQALQKLQPLNDDLVRGTALHIDHEPDPTIFFFKCRVVQPLFFGKASFMLHNWIFQYLSVDCDFGRI